MNLKEEGRKGLVNYPALSKTLRSENKLAPLYSIRNLPVELFAVILRNPSLQKRDQLYICLKLLCSIVTHKTMALGYSYFETGNSKLAQFF